MSLLKSYITHPIRTLSSEKAPTWEALLVLILASISSAISIGVFRSVTLLILGFVCIFLGLGLYLIMQSVIYDFAAQILGHKGASYRLFKWTTMTLMPTLLTVPIEILFSNFPGGIFISGFIKIILICAMFYLQIETLKAVYCISFGRGVLISCLPILALACLIGLFYLAVVGAIALG
ncbi:MAG: hypothetical protein HRT90_03870 [Candidatus Margulisbacteria bacterium]|nr:hypothetical protein [Candidatus Margulisiibacteriota bacterium]